MKNIPTVFRLIQTCTSIIMLAAALFWCCQAYAEPAEDALFRNGAIQRVADSYLSPLPIVPDIKTGDIIIENNLAFPQYYAVFGTLMPDLRYVHAQMVISGDDLHRELHRIEMMSGRSTLLKTMRVKTRKINSPVGEKIVNVWEPCPSVDRSRLGIR